MSTDRLRKFNAEQGHRLAGWRLVVAMGLLILCLPMSFAADTTTLNFKGDQQHRRGDG